MVRIIGQLRTFNNTRSIVAYSIQPISDFNEYTFHFIDVVHTHLRHTKGKPMGGMAAAPPLGFGMKMDMPAKAGYRSAPTYDSAPATGADVHSLVISFFKTKGDQSEMGCRIQDVFAAVAPQGISEQRVREAVEFLTNEGHLYSTIDDDHYKATG